MKISEITKKKIISDCSCPLCGNSDIEIIREYKSKDCLIHLGITFNNQKYNTIVNKLKNLWGQDSSYFIACKKCFIHFAYPFKSGDNEFYSILYDKESTYPEWKWDFEKAFVTLSNLITDKQATNNRLLEIGAGAGFFVKRLSDSLIESKRIVTTEYSDFGRKKINELGIQSLPISIMELLNEEESFSFDYICMFQVLEHLDNLDDVFKSLCTLMKTNGRLLITVPNNLHRILFEKLGITEDVPPIHVSRWDIKSFQFVAQKYGLEIIDHQFQDSSSISNMLKYLGFQFQKNKVSKKLIKMNRCNTKIVMVFIVYAFFSIWHIRQLFSFLFKKNMGISQMIHFKKI